MSEKIASNEENFQESEIWEKLTNKRPEQAKEILILRSIIDTLKKPMPDEALMKEILET